MFPEDMITLSVLLIFLACCCIAVAICELTSKPLLSEVLSVISAAASSIAMRAFGQALQKTGHEWIGSVFFWGFVGLIGVSVLVFVVSILFYFYRKRRSAS